MTRKFYIHYEDICPQCNGKKVVQDPLRLQLAAFLSKWDQDHPLSDNATDCEKECRRDERWQAERSWWLEVHNVHVLGVSRDAVSAEVACSECEGTGVIKGRMHLKVALRALGYRPAD